MSDAEKYTAFFIACLVFCESYEQLQEMWTDQATNRLALGITREQTLRMVRACADRRAALEGPPTLL